VGGFSVPIFSNCWHHWVSNGLEALHVREPADTLMKPDENLAISWWRGNRREGMLQVSRTISVIKCRTHVYKTSCITLNAISNKFPRSDTSYLHRDSRLSTTYR